VFACSVQYLDLCPQFCSLIDMSCDLLCFKTLRVLMKLYGLTLTFSSSAGFPIFKCPAS